jgi:hypothetical protein
MRNPDGSADHLTYMAHMEADMAEPGYFDVLPERTRLRGEYGDYRPCDESGPYATRCTLPPMHNYAHYDGSDDSSWTDRWRDEGPDDEDEDDA